MVEGWKNESKSDSEYGQDKFDASIETASKALDTFGDDSLLEILETTGLGNHPAMVRFVVKVGQALSEDNPMSGHGSGQAKEVPVEDILYPQSN